MKQIVISVPEEWLEGTPPNLYDVMGAVMNGTVLPEHYGRLMDADAYIEKHAECGWLDDITVDEFNKITPTIIPATKEEKQIKKCCFTCKWDYSNFKEYADEATKLAHCRNCKLASGYEPMKEGDGE